MATELKEKGRAKAKNYSSCTVLFSDFVGFTKISGQMPPEKLVRSLDLVFAEFDEITERHGLEKLKTIGDAYMCAGGIPNESSTHLVDSVLAALEMLDFLKRCEGADVPDGGWCARFGVHSGPVTAGVIGRKKFAYDVWGDTVNIAARMESGGEAGKVNMSESTYQKISDYFIGVERGNIEVKGKGSVPMVFVTRIKPEYSRDEAGMIANEEFRRSLASTAGVPRGE